MIGFWIFIMRQMQSGGNKALSFGKSRAKLSSSSQKKVTFKDVSGVDEAKEELQEIIEFLKEPQKFQKLGGRIPKGVLLMGSPGTGKTLLARAVAGEANVPFFSISGSDFVEMFVGVGASRVRDLFEQGKKNAPCIVFIDEIDAVGRHRGAGLGGGHDEREQTLNQLLVEMDGFESNEGVILVAATNRPDVLDPALLRPGRFDRRIVVNRPDVKGREGILAVHTKKIPLADDVNIHVLARGTSGFSGADLANLVNEAALNAARYNQKVVRMLDFEFAKDKVLMGSERRSMIISDEEKKVTAVHEAGHALLAVVLPHADPVHKVTIIPRGMALGVTMQLPVDDKHNYTRDYLNDQIAILLGGRIAEEITMNGSMTTGAGNDLERSTELARKMVCEWGMSDAMGPLTFGKKEEQIFLGREIAQHQDYSEDTAIRIDQEIKRFVTNNYDRARAMLEKHRVALDRIAEELLVREVLDAEQVRRIVAGEALEEHRAPRRRLRRATTAAASRASARRSCRRCRRSTSRCRRNSRAATTSRDGKGQHRLFPFVCLLPFPWRRASTTRSPLPGRSPLVLGARTLVMGIINVTPDSFADGGRRFDPARAVDAGWQMLEDGADILDVGGESTRPGAEPVDAAEELRRVLPVLEAFAGRPLVSIDTYKAVVAREAIARGAAIVNDISGLQYDQDLAGVVAESGAAVVLMHNRGRSRDMYREAVYDDAPAAMRDELQQSIAAAVAAGVRVDQVIVDPGFGFAKKAQHSYQALAGLDRIAALGRPILAGAFAQVVSPRRHRRRAAGRTRVGDRRGRRRQCIDGCAHRPSARRARDGSGRQGGRRHPRRAIVSGSLAVWLCSVESAPDAHDRS